jgi:Fe-S-cluster-containing dehydrogenase component
MPTQHPSCPNTAIERGADGVVRIIPDKCDHQGKCETACPYGAIGCDENDIADKCDALTASPSARCSSRPGEQRIARRRIDTFVNVG